MLPLVELLDGDVLVVTSKVVSKAEGRVVTGAREDLLEAETARVVARRGPTRIVRTHHGLTMAAAGIDASNVAPGSVVLLPDRPRRQRPAAARRGARAHRSQRRRASSPTPPGGPGGRARPTSRSARRALVCSTTTAAGWTRYGNPLAVTAPAVADEIAGAVELAQGKLAGRPVAVLRGRDDLVLPAGERRQRCRRAGAGGGR